MHGHTIAVVCPCIACLVHLHLLFQRVSVGIICRRTAHTMKMWDTVWVRGSSPKPCHWRRQGKKLLLMVWREPWSKTNKHIVPHTNAAQEKLEAWLWSGFRNWTVPQSIYKINITWTEIYAFQSVSVSFTIHQKCTCHLTVIDKKSYSSTRSLRLCGSLLISFSSLIH